MFAVQAKAAVVIAIAVQAVAGLKVHEADPCTCLTWQDVYTERWGGICGESGRETSFIDGGVPPQVIDEFCTRFFTKINDNFCVNWDFDSGKSQGKQWCYVSAECKDLGDGTLANLELTLAYKTCKDNDQKLVLKSPLELQEVALKDNMDVGLLSKWAYPSPGKYSEMTEADKETAETSQYPNLWDSDDGHPPFNIFSGRSQYKIDFLPYPDGRNAYTEGRMSKVSNVTCISHC